MSGHCSRPFWGVAFTQSEKLIFITFDGSRPFSVWKACFGFHHLPGRPQLATILSVLMQFGCILFDKVAFTLSIDLSSIG